MVALQELEFMEIWNSIKNLVGRATFWAGPWSLPDQFLRAVGVVAHHASADQGSATDGSVQTPA